MSRENEKDKKLINIAKLKKVFKEIEEEGIDKDCKKLFIEYGFVAEFVGMELKVIASSSTFKGVKGIILEETRNTFKILTLHKKKKRIQRIPKKGNVFVLSLKGESFEVVGDDINYTPIERAKRMRKWRVWKI